MIVYRAQREDRGNESLIRIYAPIAQHQHLRTLADFTLGAIAQALDRALQTNWAV